MKCLRRLKLWESFQLLSDILLLQVNFSLSKQNDEKIGLKDLMSHIGRIPAEAVIAGLMLMIFIISLLHPNYNSLEAKVIRKEEFKDESL